MALAAWLVACWFLPSWHTSGGHHLDANLRYQSVLAAQSGAAAEVARRHPRRALATYERALAPGPEHPGVAECLATLVLVYRQQGRLSDAEPLCRRALAIYEKALGTEHPDTVKSLNQLAELYREQGRLSDAEALLNCASAVHDKSGHSR